MNGDGEFFDLCDILEDLKFDFSQFQQMCVPGGCDYFKNWRGIGIHRACDMAGDGDDLDALKSKGADHKYCKKFKMALVVFKHQTVFDLESCSTRPLEKWEYDPSKEIQHLCGLYPNVRRLEPTYKSLLYGLIVIMSLKVPHMWLCLEFALVLTYVF